MRLIGIACVAIACSGAPAPAPAPALVPIATTPPGGLPDAMVAAGSDADLAPCPPRRGRIGRCIGQHVRFGFGKANIDAEAIRVIDIVADAMHANRDVLAVELRGSYSTIEPAGLAKRRADAVHGELVQRGIDPARLRVVDAGQGEAATRELERDVWIRIDEQHYWHGVAQCTPLGEVYRPCRR